MSLTRSGHPGYGGDHHEHFAVSTFGVRARWFPSFSDAALPPRSTLLLRLFSRHPSAASREVALGAAPPRSAAIPAPQRSLLAPSSARRWSKPEDAGRWWHRPKTHLAVGHQATFSRDLQNDNNSTCSDVL